MKIGWGKRAAPKVPSTKIVFSTRMCAWSMWTEYTIAMGKIRRRDLFEFHGIGASKTMPHNAHRSPAHIHIDTENCNALMGKTQDKHKEPISVLVRRVNVCVLMERVDVVCYRFDRIKSSSRFTWIPNKMKMSSSPNEWTNEFRMLSPACGNDRVENWQWRRRKWTRWWH